VLRHYVGPHHFQTLGVRLVRGRVFTAEDRAGHPRVAVINETAVRRFWPHEDPIGQRVWFGGGSSFDRPDSSAEIVGIVGDVPYQPLDEHGVQADFYTPYLQFTYPARMVIVRTAGESTTIVPDIRRAFLSVDRDVPLYDVQPMEDRITSSWARQRYNAQLMTVFAAVALLIATTGVYGVISHAVGQRTQELGVRIALGATREDVLRLVLGRSMVLTVLGLGIGTLGAVVLGRALRALLYEVQPSDPLLLSGLALLLGVAAFVAGYVPARRATRVDPAVALRVE
jgi:putative ABC transport system permease protein